MSLIRQQADYYQSLLCAQYKDQPNAQQTISIYVKQALGDMLATSLATCFDLDEAVGVQLDTVGKYIGVSRTINEVLSLFYYEFSDYQGFIGQNGFRDYTNPATNAQGVWFQYGDIDTSTTMLNDTQYAFLLKLQIILNSNDGTLASIMQYLQTFLPGLVELVDNANMTVTYTLTQAAPVPSLVLAQYLPKPMGVQAIFIYLSGSYPTPITASVTGSGVQTVTSTVEAVTVFNGIGPYTYLWNYVSGSASIVATPSVDPTNANRQFSLTGTGPLTESAVWQCTITDSRGIVGFSNLVNITLTINP